MHISTSRIYSLLLLKIVGLVFPPKFKIEGNRLTLFTHESLLFFWDTNEESVFLRDITAINSDPGIVWDKLSIDTRSGSDSIVIRGLKKSEGRKFKQALLQVTR